MIESKLSGQLIAIETQKNTSKILGVCLASLGYNLEKDIKMKTLKEKKKEAKNIVLALNSTGPNYDQYPWGNSELTKLAMQFLQESLISYNKFSGLWKVGPK